MFFSRSKIKEDPVNIASIRSDAESDKVFQRLIMEMEANVKNIPVLEKKIINLREKINATIHHLYKSTHISDHWSHFAEEQGMKENVIFGKEYMNFRINSEYEKNPDNLDLKNLANLIIEHNNCAKKYNELMHRLSPDTKVIKSSESKCESSGNSHCHSDSLMIAQQIYPSNFGYR